MTNYLGGTIRSCKQQIQAHSLFNVIFECIIMRLLRKKKKGKKVQFYSKDRFLSSSHSRWGKQHNGGEFEKIMSSDIGNLT